MCKGPKMQFKQVVVYTTLWAFAVVTAKSISSEDQDTAESTFPNMLPVQTRAENDQSSDDFASYPYEGRKSVFATYGIPPVPQPSFGVSVNTQAVLAPQVEVLRLVEAFIQLKSEIIARFYALINDNWDLIRGVLNLIINNIQNLNAFSLKGLSVIRKIMEFALNLFADWSITLPSVTFGASQGYGQPHETYGIPNVEAEANFNLFKTQ